MIFAYLKNKYLAWFVFYSLVKHCFFVIGINNIIVGTNVLSSKNKFLLSKNE